SGWQVVTGVLATIGLYTRVLPWLQKRFASYSREQLARYASIALIVVVLPTNVYLLAWRFLDMRSASSSLPARSAADRYFITNGEYNALNYLASEVKGDDVVFASLNTGEFVPALTGARSFIGHWAQTLDFYGKRDMVSSFFNPVTTDVQREAI